jgi:hypothetical protein
MANNQNQKANGTTTEQVMEGQQQVQQAPVQAEPQNVQANQPAVTEQQKGGIGDFVKRHWKGLLAGLTGTGAAVTSAILAYKKGKQAGMQAIPPQVGEPEDYSLNPNE